MTELLACPFCGGQGRRGYCPPRRQAEPQHYVRCRCCAAEAGWAKTEGGAVLNWNRRSKPEADQIEAIKKK